MQNFRHVEKLRDEVVPLLQATECGGVRYCWVAVRLLWSFTAVIATFTTLGCGTTHATLNLLVPTTAAAGRPFTITATLMYGGKQDAIVNSIIHFASSDPAATLPGDYQFTSAEAGSHTWVDGVTLMTTGNQTITATMVMETGITGTATVVVSPP